jgi:hypothetical protein
MHTVDDWISYLEVLQHQPGVKYPIVVKDLIRLLRASPKDLPSREAWMTWLGNVDGERANVNLDALVMLLRGCARNVQIRIPLHSVR